MARYRYDVVVNIGISTDDANKGSNELKRQMRSVEDEAIQSQKRIDAQIKKSIDQNQQIAHNHYEDKINDYKRQVDRHNQAEKAKVEATRKSTREFDIEQRRQRQSLDETYRKLANTNAFSGAVSRNKKDAIEFGKVLDQVTGKSKQFGREILGDSNTAQRTRDNQDGIIREMLSAQQRRLQIQQQDLKFEKQYQQNSINQTKDYWRNVLRQNADAVSMNQQIAAKDPFQSIGARNRNLSSVGRELKTSETNSFNNAIKSKDPFQNQGAGHRSLQDASKDLREFESQTRKSTNSLGMWGQAFKGAFIGAIAGMVFSVIIGGITGITQSVVGLGVESVKLAGDFEVTTNALAAFTGSTRSAKRELGEMDEVARNTAGLRMIPAEEGYQRLRALGFQAEQAKSFIKELGEEKILSGASDEALGRIIFNFAQIASGGQKISQELREILTQMPSMRNAFFEAFGSLDPKKIQVFFDKNTDEAFKKLTDAMAKQKAASGGLNDAWGKLADEAIKAGRNFGEPFLEPVTNDLRDLSKEVGDNQSAWQAWGVSVSDTYRGVSGSIRELYALMNGLNSMPFTKGIADTIPDGTASVVGLSALGVYLNRANKQGEALRKISETAKQTGVMNDGFDPQAQGEIDAVLLNTEQKLLEFQQKAIQKRLAVIQDYHNEKLDIIQDNARMELAIIDSTLTNTVEQEIDVLKRRETVLENSLKQQIAEIKSYYAERIKLNAGNEDEVIKLQLEMNQKIRGLSSDLAEQQLRFQKELAEKERQILEQRRQAQIDALELNQRQIEQIYDKRISDTERAIDRETTTIEAGYDRLITLTQDKYEYLTAFTKQQYALRLQDEKLTVEQRANLEREASLDLIELEQQKNDKLRQIEDKRYEDDIKRIEKKYDKISQTILQKTRELESISTSLNPANIDKNYTKNLGQFIFGGSGDYDEVIAKPLADAKKRRLELLEGAKNAMEGIFGKGAMIDLSIPELKAFADQLDEQAVIINTLTNGYSDYYIELYKTVKLYSEGKSSLKDFEEAQLRLFDKETEAQLVSFRNEWRKLNELFDQAQKADRSEDQNKYRSEINALEDNRNAYLFDRQNKRLQLYKETITGINEDIADLLKGEAGVIRRIGEFADKNALQEQRDILTQIRTLEYELINPDINAEYKTRLAVLEKQLELRNREADALTRIAVAQQEISQKGVFSQNQADADLAEFFANQKGLTESLSDARINLITKAYDGLDRVAENLAKNFGFAKDAVQDLIASLLKLAANWIFQKFLLGGKGGSSGFSLGGNGGGSGFGGIGGTPNYNPNSGNLLQQFIGGNGGGNITFPQGNIYNADGSIRYSAFTNILPSSSQIQAQGFGGINPNSGALNGINKFIAGIAPVAGFGLGNALGGGTGIGGALGGAGGLIGGTLLSTLISGGFTGATATGGIFGSIGGAIGLSGAATAGIGAAIAGVALLASFFIGRNSRRRKEERQREKAIGDAFKQLDDLIAKVNSDQIDGSQALEQADQIRQSYMDAMSQLKDKKTRTHALKDVSRLDSKIEILKSAVAAQTSRRQRLELYAPTFADGGSLSKFGKNNFRNNPLGYQRGYGSDRSDSMLGYFPASNSFARFSDSEYVLDAQTTRRIGVERLDLIRQSKGEILNSMLFRSAPKRADGGTVIAQTSQPATATQTQTPVEVHIHTDGSALGDIIAQALSLVVKNNNGSSQQMQAITQNIQTNGQSKFIEEIAELVAQKLRR